VQNGPQREEQEETGMETFGPRWGDVPVSMTICCTFDNGVLWPEEYQREMDAAALMPLPDEDDDV